MLVMSACVGDRAGVKGSKEAERMKRAKIKKRKVAGTKGEMQSVQ